MSVEAVLLDSGGVFLQPDADRMLGFLAGYDATVSDAAGIDRAHFAANNTPGTAQPADYWREFVARCGVPAGRVDEAGAALTAVIDASWWTRPVADSAAALRSIAGRGVRTAIVSNAEGTAERLLCDAEICQVGPGTGVPIDVVVDSHLVGIEKPDPRIFAIALDTLGVPAERALHVGDTVWADVRGARAAGVRPVHLDPYGDCPDPRGDHVDIRSLAEVVDLLGE